MRIILLPTRRDLASLPEGMIHDHGTRCPFEGDTHPRGSTCCSFDATEFYDLLHERVSEPLAKFMCKSCTYDWALEHGLFLREEYVNMMAFHYAHRERNGDWQVPPMSKGFATVCSRDSEIPNWSFGKFAEVFKPLGQASEWFLLTGKHHFDVHATRARPGRK